MTFAKFNKNVMMKVNITLQKIEQRLVADTTTDHGT